MSKQLFEGARHTFYGADPKYVIVIGSDTEHKSRADHPLFDDRVHEELDRPFIENIKDQGVLEPVIVRKEGDDAVVVAGRRRTLALRIANDELVKEGKSPHELPIIGEKSTDDIAALERMIAENMGRKEPNPMQKAMLLKYWFERPENEGKTDGEAAVKFAVTATSIRNWKKLWHLDVKVQKAVMKGDISPNAAADLSDLEPKAQVEKLKEYKEQAGGKPVTTRHTETARQQRKGSVAATAYTPPKMTVLRKVAEDEAAMSKLPDLVVRVVKFVTGISDGSDLPELKELVEETPGRGKRNKEKAGPKLSKAQQAVLDQIDDGKGEVLFSGVKKGPAEALLKMGLVVRFEGKDGLLYLRKFDPSRPNEDIGSNGAGEGRPDPDEVQIPDLETLENMPAKELVQLVKDLQIDMSGPKFKALKGRDLQSARVAEVIKIRKARAKAEKAAKASGQTMAEA